jgi:hypothetical protein
MALLQRFAFSGDSAEDAQLGELRAAAPPVTGTGEPCSWPTTDAVEHLAVAYTAGAAAVGGWPMPP